MANALVASHSGAGSLTYVHFLSLSDSSLLWSSQLQMRNGCAYAYISSVFTCPANSFAVAIDGTDIEGHPIRSISNVHCIGTPPPTLCTNLLLHLHTVFSTFNSRIARRIMRNTFLIVF